MAIRFSKSAATLALGVAFLFNARRLLLHSTSLFSPLTALSPQRAATEMATPVATAMETLVTQ